MRNSIKRAAVAIAGLAIASGAVLATAPAAEAATVSGRSVTVVAGHHGDDDRGYSHQRYKHHYKHYKKRYHHKKNYRWKEYGRYRSYSEAYAIGHRYNDDWWDEFNCRRDGDVYVLTVREDCDC